MTNELLMGGQTMKAIADELGRRAIRTVIDRTGFTGTFDLDLTYSPAPGLSADTPGVRGPTLAEAIRDQLGLRLEPQSAAVEVLVIDSIQQPTEN